MYSTRLTAVSSDIHSSRQHDGHSSLHHASDRPSLPVSLAHATHALIHNGHISQRLPISTADAGRRDSVRLLRRTHGRTPWPHTCRLPHTTRHMDGPQTDHHLAAAPRRIPLLVLADSLEPRSVLCVCLARPHARRLTCHYIDAGGGRSGTHCRVGGALAGRLV